MVRPCRVFGPVFEKSSEANPDVVFGKVNTEDQPDLAGTFGIQAIPTLIVPRPEFSSLNRPVRCLGTRCRKLIDESRRRHGGGSRQGGRPGQDGDRRPRRGMLRVKACRNSWGDSKKTSPSRFYGARLARRSHAAHSRSSSSHS